MGKVLRDIWILTENGVTVFSRVVDPRVNPQLFGALMSALNTYAEKLTEGGISNFEMRKIRFVIVKMNKFLFVANSSNKIKTKKVLIELKVLAERFFKIYAKDLENWNSDVGIFTDFETHIGNSLEEISEKFQKGFW